MQIAAVIQGLFAKGVKVADFLLRFGQTGRKSGPAFASPEEAAAASRARWFAGLGGREKIKGAPPRGKGGGRG